MYFAGAIKWYELIHCCYCYNFCYLEAIDDMELLCKDHGDDSTTWWKKYFVPNWVNNEWPLLWSDIERHKAGNIYTIYLNTQSNSFFLQGAYQRVGLWHTNNLSENMIRRLGKMFLGGKRTSLDRMLRTILDIFLPWVETFYKQGEVGLHQTFSKADQELENAKQNGQLLFDNKMISPYPRLPGVWQVKSQSLPNSW